MKNNNNLHLFNSLGIYYLFIIVSIFKRTITWVLVAIYLLLAILAFVVIPYAVDTHPFGLWTMNSIKQLFIFLGSIVASFEAIIIFKESWENGSDLIITSKQISRQKMVIAKYLGFFTYVLVMTLLVAAMSFFTGINKEVSTMDVWSLFLSSFIYIFLLLSIFGLIGIIVSIKLNKIWTILINISIAVTISIYTMAAIIIAPAPITVMLDSGYVCNTRSAILANKKITHFSSIYKSDILNIDTEDNIDVDLLYPRNFAEEKEVWKKYDKITDIAKVTSLIYNANFMNLRDYSENDAADFFGGYHDSRYIIKQRLLELDDADQPLMYWVPTRETINDIPVFNASDVGDIETAAAAVYKKILIGQTGFNNSVQLIPDAPYSICHTSNSAKKTKHYYKDIKYSPYEQLIFDYIFTMILGGDSVTAVPNSVFFDNINMDIIQDKGTYRLNSLFANIKGTFTPQYSSTANNMEKLLHFLFVNKKTIAELFTDITTTSNLDLNVKMVDALDIDTPFDAANETARFNNYVIDKAARICKETQLFASMKQAFTFPDYEEYDFESSPVFLLKDNKIENLVTPFAQKIIFSQTPIWSNYYHELYAIPFYRAMSGLLSWVYNGQGQGFATLDETDYSKFNFHGFSMRHVSTYSLFEYGKSFTYGAKMGTNPVVNSLSFASLDVILIAVTFIVYKRVDFS